MGDQELAELVRLVAPQPLEKVRNRHHLPALKMGHQTVGPLPPNTPTLDASQRPCHLVSGAKKEPMEEEGTAVESSSTEALRGGRHLAEELKRERAERVGAFTRRPSQENSTGRAEHRLLWALLLSRSSKQRAGSLPQSCLGLQGQWADRRKKKGRRRFYSTQEEFVVAVADRLSPSHSVGLVICLLETSPSPGSPVRPRDGWMRGLGGPLEGGLRFFLDRGGFMCDFGAFLVGHLLFLVVGHLEGEAHRFLLNPGTLTDLRPRGGELHERHQGYEEDLLDLHGAWEYRVPPHPLPVVPPQPTPLAPPGALDICSLLAGRYSIRGGAKKPHRLIASELERRLSATEGSWATSATRAILSSRTLGRGPFLDLSLRVAVLDALCGSVRVLRGAFHLLEYLCTQRRGAAVGASLLLKSNNLGWRWRCGAEAIRARLLLQTIWVDPPMVLMVALKRDHRVSAVVSDLERAGPGHWAITRAWHPK